MLFESSRHYCKPLKDAVDNIGLIHAGNFDLCILENSEKGFGYKQGSHVWLTSEDFTSGNVLLAAYCLCVRVARRRLREGRAMGSVCAEEPNTTYHS